MRYILLLGLFLPCVISQSLASENPARTYIFGVFPYLSPARLEPIYAPVSVELGKAIDRNVNFRTASRFSRFFAKLERQYYDIALIQPFWYPPAVDEFGYIPIVRMKEPFVSIILVLEDSPVRTIFDLKGKLIATPPAAVPVVHMARRALKKNGLIPERDIKFEAFKTVDSCLLQVIIGKADACVSPVFAPEIIEEKMNVRFREVLRSSSIPNLSLVVHSRISSIERERIKKLFLSWNKNESGRLLLSNMKTQGFVQAIDNEYDIVRMFLREIKKDKKNKEGK